MDTPIQGIFFKDFKNSYIPDILDEIYLKKVYEPFLTGKRDLVIVDAGANIGLTSYYFSKYAKRIYAIEPAKSTLEILAKMIMFNNLTNITVCPYALSNTNGTEKFYHNTNTTANNLIAEEKAGDYEEVRTLTMDVFMKENKIEQVDFMKLDIEGMEAKFVMSEGFRKCVDRVKVICGEIHDWMGTSPINFQQSLEELGYKVIWNRTTKAQTFSAIRL